jgi:hypothetical protein
VISQRNSSAISYGIEKQLQLYTGRCPTVFYTLYRMVRKNPARIVGPETQLVVEGFPRSANTFAVVAFRRAQKGRVRVAHNLHVPAQVIRASRMGIPTLVLIRKPKDAVRSLVVRDPISVDQALKHYISFYSVVAEYRGSYVLGRFEEVTEDYGTVIQRINAKFDTGFSPFRHTKNNLRKVFARIDQQYKKTQGMVHREARISRPSVARDLAKVGVEYETKDPKRRQLISEAEAIYAHLVGPGT